jgi:PAS domain S-box-containing protein
MVTLRDTTALVEAQQALSEREARYRQLTDISPSSIMVECEGAVVFANPAAVRLFGARTDTDLIGQDALDLVHPKDRALILELRSKLQGPDKGLVQPATVSFLRLDGTAFTGEGIGTRFRWNGKPAVLDVIHDVTALRRAEADLRAAKDAAERANTTKSRFLAAASHDLRQPLHALALFLGALSERLQGSAYSELMDKMEQSLESANSLLETVLDISKLDAGVVVPDPNDFSVQIILDQMATEFSLPAAGNGNRLQVMPCDATIRSDRVLLENILRNLVSNAVQYTRNGRILVGCRRRPEGLRLEVRDTGAGIPQDKQDIIFEEFRRLADQPQSADSGLGLGLAIVERTAKLLGCRVELTSEVGKGSVFTLNVPLGEKIAHPTVPRPEIVTGVPPSFRDATVLLIEDDPNILRAIPEYLTRWGCHCVTATSAEGAIAELSATGRVPDLIMADYHLGDGKTGIDAIRTIQSRWRHFMPSIIVTADTSAEISRRVEEECIALVYKPAQPAKLRALLLHLLQANASLEMTSTTRH